MAFRSNALIPEFVVNDWLVSRRFYCDLLGFETIYDREDEGFAFLALGEAQLMICQLDRGRMFDAALSPHDRPYGRGVNLQIQVSGLGRMLDRLAAEGVALSLPLEEKWYRRAHDEVGQRQFIVADPDGYLLRFCEDLGTRPLTRGTV